ncbi:unnamed protein product [Trifolium pratense]|uniref:Uncharacterized protein n=1 Tax=Trifolium pratense TaxID=57577 RepID=A0ACB0I7G8_TRIPR|nr:unnamed protein product [Trifolium pratense]
MAGLVRTFLTKQHVLISEINDHNPLTMSDELILEEIYSTHVHSHTKFDAESLFNIAAEILKGKGNQGSLELYNAYPPAASFTSPLCILKQINAEFQPTEPLAKSLAILKRVPQLTNLEALKKHHNAILELNNLIKTTLQVIDIIIELERLNSLHGFNGLALEQFPVYVFWVIINIVAIVTQIECLTTDSDKRQNLSQFGEKINIIISKLRNHVTQCNILIGEAEYKKTLKNLFQSPTEVMEVFIFNKDAPQESIY